jgi:hypothetical protein
MNDDGMLRLPSSDEPRSGWSATANQPGFSRVEYPDTSLPAGTVMTAIGPVDADVARELGLVSSGHTADEPDHADAPADHPPVYPEGDGQLADEEWADMTDEELAELQAELDERQQREPSLSETMDDIAVCFDPADLKDGIDAMVAGDLDGTIDRLAEATGLSPDMAPTLIETAVMDVAPIAAEFIGGERYEALVYAASQTDDPLARRIVADFVTGQLHPRNLAEAYSIWYRSLPDADA